MPSEAAEQYRQLAACLDALIEAGEGDGEKANALRGEMDEPWYAMTAEEQDEFCARG